ncbi:MAG: DUF5134 domain-containing protein [Solirubrobacterales bacterium]|nr:DUF5134 domain-containing protein [Solirubrobacterales bacterium]
MVGSWLGHAEFRGAVIVVMALGGIIALIHLARALVSFDPHPDPATTGLYVTDIEADLGHTMMLAAMALMVVAITVAIPVVVFRWIFAVFSLAYAGVLAVRIVQARRAGGSSLSAKRAAGAAYHLVAGLAMLATTVGTASASTGADPAAGADAGSGMAMAMPAISPGRGSSGGGPPLPWLLWVLTVLFLLDAAFTIYVVARRRSPTHPEHRLPRRLRLAVVPHVVMDLGMGLMIAAVL